jgi:NADH/F420H2 dehydrogenase subunit C
MLTYSSPSKYKQNFVYLNSILFKIPRFLASIMFLNDHLIFIINKHNMIPCFNFFKHNTLSLFSLIDITALDLRSYSSKYVVIYQLLSINFNYRVTIKILIDDKDPNLSSLVNIYPSSNWLEREIWDLFGIFFSNHPDLRRILTDYGFQGFPLRKDFPLTGFVELFYSEENKRIMYAPVELAQEYRFFDFLSSWQI